jgi:hypothetical protein
MAGLHCAVGRVFCAARDLFSGSLGCNGRGHVSFGYGIEIGDDYDLLWLRLFEFHALEI